LVGVPVGEESLVGEKEHTEEGGEGETDCGTLVDTQNDEAHIMLAL